MTEKMTVEVDIQPTAVNEFVAKAVLESTVGQAVKEVEPCEQLSK